MNNKPVSSVIKNIAIGYILIYVHINIGTLDILPDFLGYFIIVRALPRLAQREKSAMLIKTPGIILAVWNIIKSVVTLTGGELDFYIINVIISILTIYFNFQLITNIAEFAPEDKRKKRLLMLRSGVVIFHTVTIILIHIPSIRTVAIVTAIAQLVMLIWICIELFQLAAAIKKDEQESKSQECKENTPCASTDTQAPEVADDM